jgi:hypothetical protein
MKIATFNVNGVNGRLPLLMRWLVETEPDVAWLQELKAADEKFPEARNPGSRLPRGLAWPEELERRRHTCAPGTDGNAPRPTGRSRGCAQPLSRPRSMGS